MARGKDWRFGIAIDASLNTPLPWHPGARTRSRSVSRLADRLMICIRLVI
ncbi:unnamed protein product [Ceutorhynchus assimilis]|uniref:Uncharacterized protein n=1 Tax=Ceutorhynchus assimilis TaxID=467358 RepID=A0A9N9MSQ9_9CUCU|nr:unnamed protein product [Ceutorhynchus assimilis]